MQTQQKRREEQDKRRFLIARVNLLWLSSENNTNYQSFADFYYQIFATIQPLTISS